MWTQHLTEEPSGLQKKCVKNKLVIKQLPRITALGIERSTDLLLWGANTVSKGALQTANENSAQVQEKTLRDLQTAKNIYNWKSKATYFLILTYFRFFWKSTEYIDKS